VGNHGAIGDLPLEVRHALYGQKLVIIGVLARDTLPNPTKIRPFLLPSLVPALLRFLLPAFLSLFVGLCFFLLLLLLSLLLPLLLLLLLLFLCFGST
jgi:hypothetical protein